MLTKIKSISAMLFFMSLLISCGGGSGDSSSTTKSSQATNSSSSSSSSSADPNIGRYSENELDAGNNKWEMEYPVRFAGFIIDGLNFYNSDGSHGLTEMSPIWSSYVGREHITTHIHLGSIEFYSIPSTRVISIFDLLRTYNHKSNEILNLVRLLMLIDENHSSSNHIIISEESRNHIKQVGLLLNDLYIDINEFENTEKIKSLVSLVNLGDLPTYEAAEEYLFDHLSKWIGADGYSQWIRGRENDFDGDGFVNTIDEFPWDRTQSKDTDKDRQGDDPQVTHQFIETRGVKRYATDAKNSILYVADYHRRLSKYNLLTGQFLSQIELDGYITDLELNSENSELYVSTVNSYMLNNSHSEENQSGKISIFLSSSDEIFKEILIDAYPQDIQFIKDSRLVISALNSDFMKARLLVLNTQKYVILQDIEYSGGGGRIISSSSKLVINDFGSNSIFNISETISYYTSGSLDGFYDAPVFIDEAKDSLISVHGVGFRLTLNDGESSISDSGTWYVNYGYYDSINSWVSPRFDFVINNNKNHYIGVGYDNLIYINKISLLASSPIFFNTYSMTDTYNDISKSFAETEDNLFVIRELTNGGTQIAIFNKPCVSCDSSTTPTAGLSVLSPITNIQSEIELDSSLSFDAEDGNNLFYRWDFNSDGEWDTNFSQISIQKVKYDSAGEKEITLQVKDSSGLVNEKKLTLILDYGIYTGDIPASEDIKDISLLIEDAEFDQERETIYVTSPETKTLYAIDATTGKIIREYKFRYLPTQMAISKDNNMLYVGFNATGCYFYPTFDCENDYIPQNSGFILKFDLQQKAFIGSFDVAIAPADIFIENDLLFISSHYWFNNKRNFVNGINVYNLNSGQFIKNIPTGSGNNSYFDNIIKVSNIPIEDSCCLYVGIKGIQAFSDETSGVIVESIDYKERNWLLPDKKTAIDNTGELLNIEDFTSTGKIHLATPFGINSIAIDNSAEILFAGSSLSASTPSGGVINYYDLNSFTHLGEISTQSWPDWIFISSEKIISIERKGNYEYDINLIDKPLIATQNSNGRL